MIDLQHRLSVAPEGGQLFQPGQRAQPGAVVELEAGDRPFRREGREIPEIAVVQKKTVLNPRKGGQIQTADAPQIQVADRGVRQLGQHPIHPASVQVDPQHVIVPDGGKAGEVPHPSGKIEGVQGASHLSQAPQEIQIGQVDAVQTDLPELWQRGQEGGVLQPHVPAGIEHQALQGAAVPHRAVVPNRRAVVKRERAQRLKGGEGGEIPQIIAVDDLKLLQGQTLQTDQASKPGGLQKLQGAEPGETGEEGQIPGGGAIDKPQGSVFQIWRREGGEARLPFGSAHIQVHQAQLFTGRQGTEIPDRTEADHQVPHGGAGEPAQILNPAAEDGHALQLFRGPEIGEPFRRDLCQNQGEIAQIGHQAEKTQILVPGRAKLLAAVHAVPADLAVRAVLVQDGIAVGVEIDEGEGLLGAEHGLHLGHGRLQLLAGEKDNLISHNDHVLDPGQILCGPALGNGNLRPVRGRDRGASRLQGPPDQSSARQCQHQGRGDQNFRQYRRRGGDGCGDPFGELLRIPPGCGDDVAGVEGLFQRFRDGGCVKLQGQHGFRPGAHQLQKGPCLFRIGIHALGEHRQYEPALSGVRILRDAQTPGPQRVQHRLQGLPVPVCTQNMKGLLHGASPFLKLSR